MNKETFKNQEHYNHQDLMDLVELLRRECPWDREQTHRSIRRGMLEEAYEVAEAIDREDPAMMTEELGDLMMQILFHISLGEERGSFSGEAVYDRICKKLIFRHPHIFGDAKDAKSATEDGWAAIKRLEKGQTSLADDLTGIAKTLPALTRAEKIAGKIHPHEATQEALSAFRREAESLSENLTSEQMGKLLFSLARVAKSSKIDPEEALHRINQDEIAKICDNS